MKITLVRFILIALCVGCLGGLVVRSHLSSRHPARIRSLSTIFERLQSPIDYDSFVMETELGEGTFGHQSADQCVIWRVESYVIEAYIDVESGNIYAAGILNEVENEDGSIDYEVVVEWLSDKTASSPFRILKQGDH